MILADGQDVRHLVPEHDPRVRLIHLAGWPEIGAKRNYGCERAAGDVIAHWDDDDYSAPERLADQVQRLLESGKAVTGFHSMRFTDGVRWWKYEGTRELCARHIALLPAGLVEQPPFSGGSGRRGQPVRRGSPRRRRACHGGRGRADVRDKPLREYKPPEAGRQLETDMNLSVIIPSRTASNLIPCVEAIRRHEAAADGSIIVIDDGVDWIGSNFASKVPTTGNALYALPGTKPFIYARNCNRGFGPRAPTM